MNTDTNHEAVQKLLALKRYEQPPPRYFQDFSGSVMSRLQEAEPTSAATWWQRFAEAFEFRPAIVCGSAVAVCGLVIAGVVASFRMDTPIGVALEPMAAQPQAVFARQITPPPFPPGFNSTVAANNSSMGPVLAAATFESPFSQAPVQVEPVGYKFSFGN